MTETPSDTSCLPRVMVVTGSRAEFGLLEGAVKGLLEAGSVEVSLVVSGMHLVPRLGLTAQEVEARYPVAARVWMHPPEDTRQGMALATAEGLKGFVKVFASHRPDCILLLGDRTEAFAAALAAAYLGIPVAHIHGGDRTGNPVDDFQRDAVSRIARLHLAATPASAGRLRQMGLEGEVEVVGSPGLDAILSRRTRCRKEVREGLEIPGEKWIVVLHHPNPELAAEPDREMSEVLTAATALAHERGEALVVIYPNNDAGHQRVLREIEKVETTPHVRVFRSLPREDYLDLLSHASLLLGNSSSGIIECASLGTPVVNVGARQEGRERNANVVDAPPRVREIVEAARRALVDLVVQEAVRSRANLYGDGRACERIAAAVQRFVKGGPASDGGDPGVSARRDVFEQNSDGAIPAIAPRSIAR